MNDKKIILDDFFYNDILINLKNSNIISKNFCNKVLSKNAYKCKDCSLAENIILCEECFKNSEHVNHNFNIQIKCEGTCDCGNKEVFDPIFYCNLHNGDYEIKDDLDINLKNEIILNWKNKILFIFNEFYKIINGINSIYNLQEIVELINNFCIINKNNIIITKLFSLSLTNNLLDIQNENINIRNNFFNNINNHIKEINGQLIKIEDFNLNDILLTIDYITKDNFSLIQDLFYSLFDSINFKFKISLNYIRNIYLITKNNLKNNIENKFSLNFQILIYSNNNVNLLNSIYIKNYFLGLFYINKNYVNFYNNIQEFYDFFILNKINVFLRLLKDCYLLNYFFDILFEFFHDKNNLNIDLNEANFDINNLINYNVVIFFYNKFLIIFNKYNVTNELNQSYKNMISILIKKSINFFTLNYKKNLNEIKSSNEILNSYLLIYENFISITILNYFIKNKLLKQNKEIIITHLNYLFPDHNQETTKNLFKYFLLNIINILKLYTFSKLFLKNCEFFNLFEKSYLLMEDYFLFLLKIIKLVIGEKEFVELFYCNYFDLSINDKNIEINKNTYLINSFYKYILNININNNQDWINKELNYENLFNNLNENNKNEFNKIKKLYFSCYYQLFFTLITNIIYNDLFIEINLIKNNLDFEEYDNLKDIIINYFKIIKTEKIQHFYWKIYSIFNFTMIEDKVIFENILDKLIIKYLDFDKNNSYVRIKNNDYIIKQSIIKKNTNFFLNLLEHSGDFNKYNIFYCGDWIYKFLNKNEFIKEINNLLYDKFFNEIINNNEINDNLFLDNLDNYILEILFLFNEEGTKYINIIKFLEKFSNQKHYFNKLLNKDTDIENLKKLQLNKRNLIIHKKLDILKLNKLNKFLPKKNENIIIKDNSINEICFICKKKLSEVIVLPIEIIYDNINSFLIDNLSDKKEKITLNSCFHKFHLKCNNEILNNNFFNCLYCKKNYFISFVYDLDNFFNKNIYSNNFKILDYFVKYNLNFNSIIDEFIKLYILGHKLEKLITNEIIIINIINCFYNFWDIEKLKEIFYNLIKFSKNNKIESFYSECKLMKYFDNIDIEFIIRFFDLIITIILKLKLINNIEINKVMKEFIHDIIELKKLKEEKNVFDNIISEFKHNLNNNNLKNFNEEILINVKNNLQIDNNLEIFNYIYNGLYFDEKYLDFQKKLFDIKCDFCDSKILENILLYCLICKKYFCLNKFCENILNYKIDKNTEYFKKYENNKIEKNYMIHNNLVHSNYGLYFNVNNNLACILFNNNEIFNLSLYLNDLNQRINFNDKNNNGKYYFNEKNLKLLINNYFNKKFN